MKLLVHVFAIIVLTNTLVMSSQNDCLDSELLQKFDFKSGITTTLHNLTPKMYYRVERFSGNHSSKYLLKFSDSGWSWVQFWLVCENTFFQQDPITFKP